MFMVRTLIAAIAAAAIFAVAILVLSSSASADRIRLGLLSCEVDGGAGFILGSKKQLDCVFEPADAEQRAEIYTGSVKKIGLDIGVTDRAVIKWIVLGANVKSIKPGGLAGTYGGISASATAGLGVGANALIGGSNDFVLQPFSLEGSEGVNLAIGFSKFELRQVQD